MKIKCMKDRMKRLLNLKSELNSVDLFICILAFMLNFEIYFLLKYKTTNEMLREKDKI